MNNEIAPEPILSIAIITYNQKEFLEEAIDSILEQKTKYCYEVLICDDASTDGTEELATKLQIKHPEKIKYLRLPVNGGITKNSNLGFKNSSGKYFALIGGDDLFLPEKIERHVSFMEENENIVLSYHPVEIFDSLSNKTMFTTNTNNKETPRNLNELFQICIPGAVSIIFRRDAIPSYGFDERLRMVSDWLFYIEVAAKGDIGFLPITLARYRKHGDQASFRTYELLDESLNNINFALEKLSNRNDISDLRSSALIGKGRYLAGEGFRQLTMNNKKVAREVLYKSIKYRFSLFVLAGIVISYLPINPDLYKRIKYILK